MQVDTSGGDQSREFEISEGEDLSKPGPSARSQIGGEREANEDRYLIESFSWCNLCVVCDGMGGVAGGDIAAQMAVDSLKQSIAAATHSSPHETLLNALTKANSEIFNRRQTTSTYSMGTTIVAALTNEHQGSLLHVGDSRAYVVHGRSIEQLTKDHTYVQDWVDQGLMDEKEASDHPQAHVLNKCLGTTEEVDPGIIDFEILPLQQGETEDRLVFLSDGVHHLVSRDEICELVRRMSPAQGCFHIIELAKGRGGSDDMTVAILPLGGTFNTQHKSVKQVPLLTTQVSITTEETELTVATTAVQTTEEQQPLVLTAPEHEVISTLPGWNDSMYYEDTLSRKDYLEPEQDATDTTEVPVRSINSLLTPSITTDVSAEERDGQVSAETVGSKHGRLKKVLTATCLLGIILGGAGLILSRLSSFSENQSAPATETTTVASTPIAETISPEETNPSTTEDNSQVSTLAEEVTTTNEALSYTVPSESAEMTTQTNEEQPTFSPEAETSDLAPTESPAPAIDKISEPSIPVEAPNTEVTVENVTSTAPDIIAKTEDALSTPDMITEPSAEALGESQATDLPSETSKDQNVDPAQTNSTPQDPTIEVAPTPEVIEPQGPTAMDFFKQGLEHTKNNDTKAAREAFEQALALDPTMAEAHYNLGTMLASEKNPTLAIQEFKRALETRPDFTEALYNLGFVYYKIGNKELARNYFEQFVASANKTTEKQDKFRPQVKAVRNILKDLY